MSADTIPTRVRAFIARYIRSVIEMEMLLALHADPAKSWSAQQIAQELRVDASWAQPKLVELTKYGLLAVETDTVQGLRYRYHPASAELQEDVDQLAATYAEMRVSLTHFIFSRPEEALRNFADAFKIRKDRPDE